MDSSNAEIKTFSGKKVIIFWHEYKGSFTPSDSESGSESMSGIAIFPLGRVLLIYTSTIQTGA